MATEFTVAVAAVIMLFALIGLALALVAYVLVQRGRNQADHEYKALAEEAVRNQRALVESSQEMNRLLTDIERLLREVG